jgi:PmbA protein
MINQDYKKLLGLTIDDAINSGADAADIILTSAESLSLKAFNQAIDQFNLKHSHTVGIRLIKDGKIGISYSEKLDHVSMETMLRKALENAKNASPNQYEKLNTKAESIVVEADKRLMKPDNHVSIEAKIELALKLEDEVKKKDSRVSAVPYNGFSDNTYQHYYLNSNNCFSFQEERSVSCYTSALMKEGEVSATHNHSECSRSIDHLDWQKCVSESIEHASNFLQGKKLKTGEYDVIFDPDCFASILSCFSNIFSGKAAKEKTNPLAEKLADSVASEKLTILDLPTLDKSFIYSPFDDEGLRRSDLVLIQNGVLKNLFHNTATASYFKTESNARAARSPRSALGVGGTTLFIQAGKTSENDMKNAPYILIKKLQGLHSGTNSYSGDFSLDASGYLMQDDEIKQVVKGVTVAGNFFNLLNQIEAIGDKEYSNSSRTFFTPLIRFKALKIAGE